MADQMGVRTKRGRAIGVAAVLAMVLTALGAALGAPAGAATYPDGPGSVTVDQSPAEPSEGCLPQAEALSFTATQTATTFTVVVTASTALCEPVDVSAAIYAMPLGATNVFNAWPQTLASKVPFTISDKGTTTITFTKGCLPAQFDLITGATPQEIMWIFGPFHGPLLFPQDNETSSLLWFGGDCSGTGCESYTPTNLAVEPSSVAPGDKITVSGDGYPGTTVEISFRQPPGAPVPTGVTVVVPEDGHWSAEVTVPADMTPGEWEVVAGVAECEAVATADITVTPPTTPTTPTEPTTPTAPPADVAGATTVPAATGVSTAAAPLPAAAVGGTSATNSGAAAAGLAYTGSSVKVPVLIGIGLLVAGILLVLQRRRRSS